MTYAPTAIDLSHVAAPDALEAWSHDQMIANFKTGFLAQWALEQASNSALRDFTEQDLASHPVIVVARTWAYERGMDRQRVNDAIKALIAVLARGASLENIAASRNIQRLTIVSATASAPAVMESDAALLRRYLLSFDLPSAGSVGRYLYDAWTAWPQSEDRTLGLWDARVNGRAIHGRKGDTDVVIIGPFGRLPTVGELAAVRAAVTNLNRAPEAVAISVMAATRVTYAVDLTIEIPAIGPSPDVVKADVAARITAAATDRILVAGEIPAGLLSGAAYGANVITVTDNAPVVIAPDYYKVPVMTSLTVRTVVRS